MKDLQKQREEFFANWKPEGGATQEDAMAKLGIVAAYRLENPDLAIFLCAGARNTLSAELVEKEEAGGVRVTRLDEGHEQYDNYKGVVTSAVNYVGTQIQDMAHASSTTTTSSFDTSYIYIPSTTIDYTPWKWSDGTGDNVPDAGGTGVNSPSLDFKWDFTVQDIPKEEEEKESNYKFRIAQVDILDEGRMNQAAFAKAGLEKQPDLLYVRFKLMHEGGNKNLDWFDRDELKAAAGTPVLKHLNWEHGEPTIGTIYYAEFVDSSANGTAGATSKAHIIAEAAIWKFRYPEIANKMITRHSKGTLAFSMEAYFTQAQCSKCGEIFAASDHPEGTYCEHLNTRFDTMASADSEESVYRKLQGFILGGAGVVEDPADIDAEALALARSKEVKTLDKIELTQAELDAKIAEAVKDALAEAAKEANVGELTERADAAEATVAEQKTALESAKETIETLTTERDETKAELQELKDKAAWDVKAAERKQALDEAGYVAPEKEEEAEEAFAKFVDMSEDVFALFITTVKSGAKSKPAGSSQASARVPAAGGKKKTSEEKSLAAEAADILARL
jgi:hypothetical protein